MAEILGLGVTHYPGFIAPDGEMHAILLRALSGPRVPEAMKDPARWPEAMRAEWAAQQDGAKAAAEHRRRAVASFRKARAALDAFRPDFVLIWGDDQYENFREEVVPPFCVFALDRIECRPFERKAFFSQANVWEEPQDKVFSYRGHPAGARHVAATLLKSDIDLAYAYRMRYPLGLPHAFINTLLYLDYERGGFPYPVVPFHVNCYGSAVIAGHGGATQLDGGEKLADPPSPSPKRCFDVGAAVARALSDSPWRVALIGSSSWSHAFLTPRGHYLHPDVDADRARLRDLERGTYGSWRDLPLAEIEDAGQHEFLNWVTLAGAMSALGRKAQVLDYLESYIFNSDKCFAVFPPR